MKYIKYFILYFFILLFLHQQYDEVTFSYILFHYPIIDFRYFIFIAIQFFWVTLLFQLLYQYICLFQFMRIRLSLQRCILFLIFHLCLYCLIYIIIHICFFHFFLLQVPFNLIIINIFIQIISFIFVLFIHKEWNYSYFFIISFILFCHFVV